MADQKAKSRSAGRVDLNAISGARFFATTSLVLAHSLESLWIAQGGEAEWLRQDVCVWFKRISKDFVCFYLVLAGFVMTWGYWGREQESWEQKTSFWKRRLARFYPDYFIAILAGTIVRHQYVFGCHDMSVLQMVWNLLGLTLLPSWFYAFGPGYSNGPAWFMGTLFWLWIMYPFLIRPVKSIFPPDDTALAFSVKMAVLWLFALLPFAIIVLMAPGFPIADTGIAGDLVTQSGMDYGTMWNKFRWTVKAFPLLRISEFVMGMALAIRVKARAEYIAIDAGGEQPGGESDRGAALLPAIGVALVVAYEAYMSYVRDPKCPCMSDDFIGCYGWVEVFDTKFALVNAAIIYGIATLDVRRSSMMEGDDHEAAATETFRTQVGPVGSCTHSFLTFSFFVEVGQWGLQLYLYQMVAYFVFQALLVGLHIMEDRCNGQFMPWWGQIGYVAGELATLYTLVFFMNPKGIVGSAIIKAVDKYYLGKSSD